MESTETPTRPPVDWPGLDGVARRRFRLLAIGDVRIEARTSVPDLRFTDLVSDRLVYAPTRAVVAGTAINMARRAAGYFRRVGVLARIGDDDYTRVIRRELRRLGLRDLLRVETGAPNAVTLMLRDGPVSGGGAASEAGGGGGGRRSVRLLVADDDAANRRLSAADVRDAAAEIRRADVLYLDGYPLLSAVSRTALFEAASIARRRGTTVAFDLVPHDIDARLAAAEIVPLMRLADIVISEAPTIARLLDRPAAITSGGTRELLPFLDEILPGRPLWLLRFGASALEHTLAYQRDGLLLEYPTGYTEGVERIGFGDRLAAGELYWWLTARDAR